MSNSPLESLTQPVVIFSGNFGSGKSEVAVNTALRMKADGDNIAIVDLDVVNPYFRCREAREELEKDGIEVIAPSGEYAAADLPIILPQIRGRVMQFAGRVIIDVGGDDLGARALASLNDVFSRSPNDFVLVLNGRRPFTLDLKSTLATIKRIEEAAKLNITGLVGNTHLMEHTTVETIKEGYELLVEVSGETGLPIHYVTAMENFYKDVLSLNFNCPVLSLTRRLNPPWLENAGHSTPEPGRPWGKAPDVRLPGGGGRQS